MKIQGFLFILCLLLLATIVQETKGFGPLPPGKRRREPHRKFEMTARSLCEAARSLDRQRMKLDDRPKRRLPELMPVPQQDAYAEDY